MEGRSSRLPASVLPTGELNNLQKNTKKTNTEKTNTQKTNTKKANTQKTNTKKDKYKKKTNTRNLQNLSWSDQTQSPWRRGAWEWQTQEIPNFPTKRTRASEGNSRSESTNHRACF